MNRKKLDDSKLKGMLQENFLMEEQEKEFEKYRKHPILEHFKRHIRIDLAAMLFLGILVLMNYYVDKDIEPIITLQSLGVHDEKVTRIYQERDIYGGEKYYLHLKGKSHPSLDSRDVELQLTMMDYSNEVSLERFHKLLKISDTELVNILEGNTIKGYQNLTNWDIEIVIYKELEGNNYYYLYHDNRIVKLIISKQISITEEFQKNIVGIMK